MKPRILITGAAGRIGGLLMQGLSEKFDVHGIDLVRTATGRIVKADVSDFDELSNAVSLMGRLDSIVHLAVSQDVAPEIVLKTNIAGTLNVFEVARLHRIRRVVFASSNRVMEGYEIEARPAWPPFEALTTEQPVRPASLYASTKVAGEALARQYFETHGIESICLRIGTVLGVDDPSTDVRYRRTWLSYRDLVHLVDRSLVADVKFGVYFGVSANADRFWSLGSAAADLGYYPQDNAAAWPRAASNDTPGRSGDAGVAMRQRLPAGLVGVVSWLFRNLHIAALLPERHWLARQRQPRRRSERIETIGLQSMSIQPGVLLEVFWADPKVLKTPGPTASVYVGSEEVLRLDCFGGTMGHMHTNMNRQGGRLSRLYLPDGSIADHIERAAFELEHNLPGYLVANPLPAVHRITIDPGQLACATQWMKRRMFELMDAHGDRQLKAVERATGIEPV